MISLRKDAQVRDDRGRVQPSTSVAMPTRVRTKMRVAILTESYQMGGVERSTLLLLKALDRDRYEPILICRGLEATSEFIQEAEASGFQVVQAPFITMKGCRTGFTQFPEIVRLLRGLNLDILHIQILGGTGGKCLVLAARFAGVPTVIVTIRGFLSRRLSGLNRFFTQQVDRLVTRMTVASHDNRIRQIEDAGRDPNRIQVIYNAIEVMDRKDIPKREDMARELGVSADGPVVGLLGRMAPQKGVEFFLEMAEIVHTEMPAVQFVIIGDGPHLTEYKTIARSKGFCDCVHFAGYRTNGAQLLAATDVVVLSSVFEPFGLVLAEAMAIERPIVASRVGGVPEVVVEGETALLVPPGDGRALAEAVMMYLSDPMLAAAHGKAGRRRVEQEFALSRLAKDYDQLYTELSTHQQVTISDQCIVSQR